MSTTKTMTQLTALSIALSAINALACNPNTDLYPPETLAEATEKITSMIDSLNKKRATPTKADLEKGAANESIMNKIYDTLITLNKPSSISDIQTACPDLSAHSTSKMSAMLKKLIDAGRVIRTVEKKKAMFTAVPVK